MHRTLGRVRRFYWVILVGCCAWSACGDGGSDSLSGLGVDDGAAKGVAKSEVVDGSKDVRLTLDTGALLDVPAGAVTKDVKITIERPEDTRARKLVENLKTPGRIVSAPYVLTPHGTTFKEDVTVTLPIAKEGNKQLSVAWLENEKDTKWKLLGVPKSNGEKAAITLKHFSVLVLVEGTEDLAPMTGDEGSDAGTEADAGLEELPDASVVMDAGSTPDATMPPRDLDASVSAKDAGVVQVVDGSLQSPGFYGRFEACGYVTRRGSFPEPVIYGPYQQCLFNCLYVGSCSDLQATFCNNDDAGISPVSQSLSACWQACAPIVTCATQEVGYRCDGTDDCLSGEDELNCPATAYFACDASHRVAADARCDGFSDCELGQDEADCPHHTCTSTGASIPADSVCDGVNDCGDGSDEPATCAQISCPTRT